MMKSTCTLSVLLLSIALAVDAFVVQRTPVASTERLASSPVFGLVSHLSGSSSRRPTVARWMAEEDEVDTEAPAAEFVEEAVVETEEPMAEAAEEMEEEEQPEDPEVVAIKEEIARLETSLKDKRRAVSATLDKADDYTKPGYARKIAEMENMRRARSMLASSNKSGAMAGVLVSFLPVLDKLGMLQAQHGEDEFGKSYNALQGVMRQVYIDLGTTEYTVNAGDAVDKMRVDVIEAEHSDQPADTVIRPLSMGLEIDGNVIRAAQCIASLGPVVAEDAVEEMEGGEESAGSSE